jgi:hypothetical protein
MNKLLMHPAAKPVVFLLCLLPFAWLFYGALTDQLGANPAEYLIRATGDWTLRFLCIVLAVTPLRVHEQVPRCALPPHAGAVHVLLRGACTCCATAGSTWASSGATSPRTSPSGRSSWWGSRPSCC